MTKNDCLDVFNAMIRGTPVSFSEKLLPMFSEYLTENNIENPEKLINLIVQNPQLMQGKVPEMVDYYCRKYNILSVVQDLEGLKKTILYYE